MIGRFWSIVCSGVSIPRRLRRIATTTYTETAIHNWDLTAFIEVPRKRLSRKLPLTNFKKSSTVCVLL